ncbi:FAD/NAD(P)-binding domain-containing protein [Coprinopsis marcescibilis]|uniref:FAD/NAD(P)-binding domain-containing protein n=1 Tax=Coprinopsis marcescibilis TaxID=230819 RepID=A0A5C3KW65_COPMA|nr:FAD/NAD(P)-binding domain-containing protein [Coprinopsis marcescibilis]
MGSTTTKDNIYSNIHQEDPSITPIPKRVLVIGGGPSGLVALRNLVEQGRFETIQLVERRDDIGGVWYYEDPSKFEGETPKKPYWPSPAYKGLIGNVLPRHVSFSGAPFPLPPNTDEGQPYPTLTETHAYLKGLAAPYVASGRIRVNTEVVRVEERAWGEGWTVFLKDWSDEGRGRETTEVWDAVVICVNWYDHPVWPDIEGLGALRNKGLASHAKWWRGPKGRKGKRCVVVGNANSANDIAAQLASVAEVPVYQSIRRRAFPGCPYLPDDRIQMVKPVVKFAMKHGDGGTFDAYLEDGTVLTDLDEVICGTGYHPFPDFIKVLERPQLHSTPGYDGYLGLKEEVYSTSDRQSQDILTKHVPIVKDSVHPRRIPHLHRLMFYAPNPSLAFTGAYFSLTPFITADVVSLYISLVFAHRISLPSSTAKRLEYERARLELVETLRQETQNPSSFLSFSVLAMGEEGYIQELRGEVVKVCPELDSKLLVWGPELTKEIDGSAAVKIRALEWLKARGGAGNLSLKG